MTVSEIINITMMQGFAGLSLFAVLLLMGLGLAIIFGQMGVINLAHGEFMTIGAYTIYMVSTFVEARFPGFVAYYFPFAILLAFVLAFAAGWLAEWALIRHLYKRPLDTLLATWGLSLGMQQCFRTFMGPKEVSPALPEWLLGSWSPQEGLDIPINGMFVMGLTLLVTVCVMLALYKSRWGLRVRASVSNRMMANAIGINTSRTDLRLALHRGRFPGRDLRRRGQPAGHGGFGLRHCADAVDCRVLPDRLHGQGADAVPDRADPDDPSARPVRLQGPPLSAPNPYRSNPRDAP